MIAFGLRKFRSVLRCYSSRAGRASARFGFLLENSSARGAPSRDRVGWRRKPKWGRRWLLGWKDPAIAAPRASTALLSAVDVAPTVLARAGVAAFNGIQGASLLPLLAGDTTSIRDELLIEEEGQRTYLGFSGRVRMRSLVTARHRLSVYDGVPWGELYDIAEDPHETGNLWDDAEAKKLRAELMERLARTMLAGSDTSPYADRARMTGRRRPRSSPLPARR